MNWLLQNDIWDVIQQHSYPGKTASSFNNIKTLNGALQTHRFQIIDNYIDRLLDILPIKTETAQYLSTAILEQCSAVICVAMLKKLFGTCDIAKRLTEQNQLKLLSVLMRDKDYKSIVAMQSSLMFISNEIGGFSVFVPNFWMSKRHESLPKPRSTDTVRIIGLLEQYMDVSCLLDVCLAYAIMTSDTDLVRVLDKKFSIKNCYRKYVPVDGYPIKITMKNHLLKNFNKDMYEILYEKCNYIKQMRGGVEITTFLRNNDLAAIEWIFQHYKKKITYDYQDILYALSEGYYSCLNFLYKNHRKQFCKHMSRDSLSDTYAEYELDYAKLAHYILKNDKVRNWLRKKKLLKTLEDYAEESFSEPTQADEIPYYHRDWLLTGSLSTVVKRETRILGDSIQAYNNSVSKDSIRLITAKLRYAHHYHIVLMRKRETCSFKVNPRWYTVPNAPYLLDLSAWYWNIYKKKVANLLKLYILLCKNPSIYYLRHVESESLDPKIYYEEPQNTVYRLIRTRADPTVPEKFYTLFDSVYPNA